MHHAAAEWPCHQDDAAGAQAAMSRFGQDGILCLRLMIPAQKQITGMLGHPVAENPIHRMFDAVYAHYGLNWQFLKSDIGNVQDLALAVAALRPLGYRGIGITVPYKVAVIPLLDEVDDDVRAIGAANYLTIESGRLIGHNNDGKGLVKAIEKVSPLQGARVVMLGAGGAGRAMAVELAWAGAAHLPWSPAVRNRGVKWLSWCAGPPASPPTGSPGRRGGPAAGHHHADECHPSRLRAPAGAGAAALGFGRSLLHSGGCDHQSASHSLPGHRPGARLSDCRRGGDAGPAGHADF